MGWFDDFDLGNTLSAIAPLAGKVIGGPYAALAVTAVQAVFGDEEATPKQLAKKIKNATPEQIIALRKIDGDLQVKMRELDITEDELQYKDRSDARKLFSVNSAPQMVLSALFVLGYFTVTGLLAYFALNPDPNTEINPLLFGMLGTVIGVLTAAIPQILNFWFGSSKSSQDKNQIISNVQTGKGPHQ